jgi:MFS transporter, putative metabolite:H+ symporter
MASEAESLVTLARCWASVALTVATIIFDFFIVGFLVAVLAPQWQLTFGQTSVMLPSAGVGGIVGALVWGALADRWGRKALLVVGVALCVLGSGSASLISNGAWILFVALHFVVGVGAAAAVGVPLIVECTPTRHRTIISIAMVIPVSLGVLAATLLHQIGRRGLSIGLLSAVARGPDYADHAGVCSLAGLARPRREARCIVARALDVSPETLPERPRAIGSTANSRQRPTERGATGLANCPRRRLFLLDACFLPTAWAASSQ